MNSIGTNRNDLLEGSSGSDRLDGRGGNDTLRGETFDSHFGGNDTLNGGDGNDRIGGKGGKDLLLGGSGNDRLWGDAGNDTLDGGPGNDQLTGGPGNDIFRLSTGAGTDQILDFKRGDKIQLPGSFRDYKISNSGQNSTIRSGGSTLATVKRVDLSQSDFIFTGGNRPTPKPVPSPDPQPRPNPNPDPKPSETIGRFDLFEEDFKDRGNYSNPYRQVEATATFTSPNKKRYEIPLFWNGGDSWKVRFSPETTGNWTYTIDSSDSGLDGASGSFKVKPSNNKGGIEADLDAPYHFQHEDGTPYYLIGDTHWRLSASTPSENLNRKSVFDYIDTRKRQGFTYIHANMTDFNSGGNEGGKTWIGDPGEKINPSFFEEVDRRVEKMDDSGMTLGFMLSWSQGWSRNFDTQQERLDFAEYVTSRYSAYNVVFLVSGEYNEALNYPAFDQIGQTIADTDPHDRMVGIHATRSASAFQKESWMSFGDYQQTYGNFHSGILSQRDVDKPVVNSEYGYYKAQRPGADWTGRNALEGVRHATWDSVMAGGYVVTGFGSVWLGGGGDPDKFNPNDRDYNDWEEDFLHVKELFTSVDWQELEPADKLINGPGTEYLLADKGDTYIVYTRGSSGKLALDLDTKFVETYDVDLFNPRTGQFKDYGTVRGNDKVILDPPTADDWVFALTAK